MGVNVLAALGLLAAAATAADTDRMWRELETHCGEGLCALADGSRLSAIANTTDCAGGNCAIAL